LIHGAQLQTTIRSKTIEQFDGFETRLDDFVWLVDWKGLGLPNCHIYVIGPSQKQPCKIGIAVNGYKRLAGIQTGNWAQLFVHKSAWCDSVNDARKVEHFAHLSLRAKHLTGEWFDIDADEALEVIQWSAGKVDVTLRHGVPTDMRSDIFDAIRFRVGDAGYLEVDRRHELHAAKLSEKGISLSTIKAIRAKELGF
jgi:hypothetical protein